MQEIWSVVDDFFCDTLIPADPVLADALRASEVAGLPPHSVSPAQGKFLHLLVKLHGAKKILEFGTSGGYSTIWLARALPPDGRLVSLEANPVHAAVARENIARAELSALADIRVGDALTTRPVLAKGELFEGRFVVGLGVSGKGGNAKRGIEYSKPYSFMQDYLAKMKAAPYIAPKPRQEPPMLLAGLLPKMVKLAAETHGSQPIPRP